MDGLGRRAPRSHRDGGAKGSPCCTPGLQGSAASSRPRRSSNPARKAAGRRSAWSSSYRMPITTPGWPAPSRRRRASSGSTTGRGSRWRHRCRPGPFTRTACTCRRPAPSESCYVALHCCQRGPGFGATGMRHLCKSRRQLAQDVDRITPFFGGDGHQLLLDNRARATQRQPRRCNCESRSCAIAR